ncbi:hypothetical protein PZB74_19655 [Porifericola rhodea]|uniref:hypothetical protein n=1 Tax=Porifericola rhodea TaxID=930972 RepID=UPI002665B2E9|nr:hypothetical protein [Porifericola rhodea]WKN31170.1 hypothetical protein PZB74_19655 [Porifericola rhodea]
MKLHLDVALSFKNDFDYINKSMHTYLVLAPLDDNTDEFLNSIHELIRAGLNYNNVFWKSTTDYYTLYVLTYIQKQEKYKKQYLELWLKTNQEKDSNSAAKLDNAP